MLEKTIGYGLAKNGVEFHILGHMARWTHQYVKMILTRMALDTDFEIAQPRGLGVGVTTHLVP